MTVDFSYNFARKLVKDDCVESLPIKISYIDIYSRTYVVNWENKNWAFSVKLDSNFEWKPFVTVTAYEVEQRKVVKNEWCRIDEN